MRFDFAIAQRLGDGGIVHFAMAVAAIADQVHDDRRAEGIAIIERDFAHADDGIRIFRIHVENRHGQALGEIGGEARRTDVTRNRW